MAVRTLSPQALNRALLARQLLLRRAKTPLPTALERVAGLQMQYAPAGYIGLWSRLVDFRRPALTRALQQRRVVQATAMRSTIHLVSRRDFGLFTAGIRRSRRNWWLRVNRKEVEGVDLPAAAAEVRDLLAEGPRRATDIAAHLAAAGFPKVAWQAVGLDVDLIRVPPSGTWERRRADLYALAEQELELIPASEDEGLAHLVHRYLGGFGPAPVADIATWAGVPAATLAAVVERLSLRTFRDHEGGDLLDVPRAPLPDPDCEAPVRFLPTWDATLLVHARRARVVPEEYRLVIFNIKTPQSMPTFLVDGTVAGTWRHDAGRINLDYFEPVPKRARRAVEDEAARLASFHRA